MRSDPTGQRGSATAETAVVLPVLVLLLTCALWALGAVSVQLRCVEAARAGARAAARGEPADVIRSRVREVAGRTADVDLEMSATSATVAVTRVVSPPWPALARLLQPLSVSAEARADVEGVPP
ncbi:MAG TPA: TadE family type IV pilus minor pilin [Mycobacteriales bacterium]|nr:TadE family type IV pilus minor pilin [Mycobacteriales bacterium]